MSDSKTTRHTIFSSNQFVKFFGDNVDFTEFLQQNGCDIFTRKNENYAPQCETTRNSLPYIFFCQIDLELSSLVKSYFHGNFAKKRRQVDSKIL